MRCILVGFLFVFGSVVLAGEAQPEWQTSELCKRPEGKENVVTREDFPFSTSHSLDTLQSRFEASYTAGKRLHGRLFWDGVQLRAPMWGTADGAVISPVFVERVKADIVRARQRDFASYPFFPDMGHSHIFIKQPRYSDHYSELFSTDRLQFYSELTADPETKFLYHLGEQIDYTAKDTASHPRAEELIWRYFTRNLVSGPESVETIRVPDITSEFNTARNMYGYHYWGAGYYVHASHNGCFEVTTDLGKIRFDISFESFPAAEGQSGYSLHGKPWCVEEIGHEPKLDPSL